MISEKDWNKFVKMVQYYSEDKITEKQIIRQLLKSGCNAEQYAIDIKEGY